MLIKKTLFLKIYTLLWIFQNSHTVTTGLDREATYWNQCLQYLQLPLMQQRPLPTDQHSVLCQHCVLSTVQFTKYQLQTVLYYNFWSSKNFLIKPSRKCLWYVHGKLDIKLRTTAAEIPKCGCYCFILHPVYHITMATGHELCQDQSNLISDWSHLCTCCIHQVRWMHTTSDNSRTSDNKLFVVGRVLNVLFSSNESCIRSIDGRIQRVVYRLLMPVLCRCVCVINLLCTHLLTSMLLLLVTQMRLTFVK